MTGFAASKPSATTSSVGAGLPSEILSITPSVAPASTIIMATSLKTFLPTFFSTIRPATTSSKMASSCCAWVGNATHCPFGCFLSAINAMRTPPTGPDTGRPESWVAADAPLMATTSYMSLGSMDKTVTTTCTSFRSPLTKVGRNGRSISRQARMASVDGRPSRRKNDPGIRPAAYMRSSTSTVNGKKSNPSRGCFEAVTVDSNMVSSSR